MTVRNLIAVVLATVFTVACGGTSSTPDTVPMDVSADVATDLVTDASTDVVDPPHDVQTEDAQADTMIDATVDTPTDTPTDTPFNPPACGSNLTTFRGLVPGPTEAGFNADLEAKATTYERIWQSFNAAAMHLNTDVTIASANTADRALVDGFAQDATA